MGVGGKSMQVAFATFFFFSPDCEDTQNLKMRVHVTAWTQHAPFAVVDPTTFMKEVCVTQEGLRKAMPREVFVLLVRLFTFLSTEQWGCFY